MIVRTAPLARCLVLLLVALAGCARAPSSRPPTLYAQLGGEPGVRAITERLLDRFANDPQVAPFFAHVDIPLFARHFSEFICVVADGPCRYSGDTMEEVHHGMHIDAAQFNAVVEDLTDAMTDEHVPVRVQNRLIARLAPLRPKVVYQ